MSAFSAHELGAIAIRASLEDAQVGLDQVDEVILGQVLTAGQGMNPARQAARCAGIHDAAPAALVNHVCGSGLRAVALAAQQIGTGSAAIVVAGGQESMSRAPHVAAIRAGWKFGDLALKDTLASDGLSDAFYGYPMGMTAENIARKRDRRDAQDAFALQSHQKAKVARDDGRFADEIVSVAVEAQKGAMIVMADEHIRDDTSIDR